MIKKIIWSGAALAVVAAYWFWNNQQLQAPTTSPNESADEDLTASTQTITYTDSGFASKTLTVKKGMMVTFKNNSSRSVWPASAMHPTHKVYPTIGGCLGSTFDACKGVLPGESWSFKFDIPGEWKYHDHLNPSYFGAVTVE
ncbi:MAG: hypothetical protein A3I89_00395 [Candidatus Harrisonbacteria bacterium RIFCSPLOWO2_02_FULL_41_11]|uniref:EfeO-type cupredoxin-like domain-containing protein n=1 Tax=Candidatus Harrisonbacteria bacterium RIFCSPHIGHO2_02_FULL_42_16 TaxID=1798404 RepID=A0A1G1ZIK4_9BACT|nr:MAG: hypothetical protein A3B92_02585 [Candidatus Harrisonbacteria bacterium RIFCSPHIGHO2_02_FULL_42_16]OGY67406.1 MAG: hypothetical protein A3I89_00395 [Candidatus Harrisonbacteria bacterium RIFCSPLOWO2_02_FULL_41_11]